MQAFRTRNTNQTAIHAMQKLRTRNTTRPAIRAMQALRTGITERAATRLREAILTSKAVRRCISPIDMMTDLVQNTAEINWDYASIQRLDEQNLSTRLISFNLGNAIG